MTRWIAALVAGTLALPACAPSAVPAPTPSIDSVAVLADRLHRETADVAAKQAEPDVVLARALRAVRVVDEFVSGMRDPATIDQVRTGFPAVQSAAEGVDLAAGRRGLVALAFAVDDARATLAVALDGVPTEWEREYLAAEDGVLLAVRTYAEVADRLAQGLESHAGTYAEVRAETAAFLEQRWFYRTSQEAADAYELRIRPLLEPLAIAQKQIGDLREEREGAAQAVNDATADARHVWSQRPADGTPGPSGT